MESTNKDKAVVTKRKLLQDLDIQGILPTGISHTGGHMSQDVDYFYSIN